MIAPSSTLTVPLPVNEVSFHPLSVLPSNIETHFGSCATATVASNTQISSFFMSVPQRRQVRKQRTLDQGELLEGIGFARIEAREFVHNGHLQLQLAHLFQNAL